MSHYNVELLAKLSVSEEAIKAFVTEWPKAVSKYDDPYIRIAHCIAEVLRPYHNDSVMHVSKTWLMAGPVLPVSYQDQEEPEILARATAIGMEKWLDLGLEDIREERVFLGHLSLNNYYAPGSGDPDQLEEVIRKETEGLIDREIKRAFPNVRRNTKRYKELVSQVWDKAERSIREYLQRRWNDYLRDARATAERIMKDISSWESLALSRISMAKDVQVFLPDSEVAKLTITRAEKILERMHKAKEFIQEELARREAIRLTA
jgi:hypothetical protein